MGMSSVADAVARDVVSVAAGMKATCRLRSKNDNQSDLECWGDSQEMIVS